MRVREAEKERENSFSQTNVNAVGAWFVSSDGVMRVFTREGKRMASAEDQKTLEDLVASSTIPTQLGDIKKEDLPGPEALLTPGTNQIRSNQIIEH
jgi:hypothetical protein